MDNIHEAEEVVVANIVQTAILSHIVEGLDLP